MKVIKQSWLYQKASHFYLTIKCRHLYKKGVKEVIDYTYRRILHKPMNWDNPQDLNEKINWLKVNYDTSRWSDLTDKYKVREYIEECGLGDMLVKLYGKWDRAEDINWDELPSQFVMKVNNGTGDVLICKDKSKLDTRRETQRFAQLLKKKYGLVMGEPHYFTIKPCIIAEELLDASKQVIPSSSLIDYKIWSFDGKPECVRVYYNRTDDSVIIDTYDVNWNRIKGCSVNAYHYREGETDIPRPKSLDKMLQAAAILSKGFPEVRVDLYEVDDKPYFGELTFTSSSGYMVSFTEEYLKHLGSLVIIDKDGRQ